MVKFNKLTTIIIYIFIILSFLLVSSPVSAEKGKSEDSDKKEMPAWGEKSSSVKVQVNQKNAKVKKQGGEGGSVGKNKKKEDSKKGKKDKKEKKKDKEENKRKTDKTVIQDQGQKSEKGSKKSKLEDIVERIIGRDIDKSNKNDKKLIEIWEEVLEKGYTVQDIKSAVEDESFSLNKIFVAVGLFFEKRDLITAQGGLSSVQKALISAYVTKVLGEFNQGFYSYWVGQAKKKGFSYVKQMLKNHYELEPYVEDLIGEIDYLDKKYEDNGFISYWSEKAREKGLDYVKKHLTIWKQLLPHVEEAEGKKLDLYKPEDSGIVDYWANEVEKLINDGMDLETAVQEIVKEIKEDEPEIPDDIKNSLIPYVEKLLGVTFDENNGQQMGFLSFWANKVTDGNKTLEGVTSLLDNMVNIKSEVEKLIGDINFLDDNPQDDGFITYWAERAADEGVTNIKELLSAMNSIKNEAEALIGTINLLDDNSQDDGFLTSWAEKAVQEGVSKVESTLGAMNEIRPEVESLIGEVNLLDDSSQDDGFLTYWANEARKEGVGYIKQHLQIWNELIPTIEKDEGRELDLFNDEDTGLVDYWTNEVERLMNGEGLSLNEAIGKVKELILKEEPTVYNKLKSPIEDLLGVAFDEESTDHMGFLTYWSEQVTKLMENEGLSEQEAVDQISSLLDNMAQVKPEVEGLIGEINLLDDDAADDGFLTYWAEYAQENGVSNVKNLLSDMSSLRSHLEKLVGSMNLLDGDYNDNGLLTYWAEYAQDNSLEKAVKIVDNTVEVKDEVESLIGPVDFYDNQYGDNGFITYWAEYALEEGVTQVESLLTNMKSVKEEVENLIGEVDFFDESYEDNGFITFWAEYAQKNNVQEAKNILHNMNSILNNDWDENDSSELEELIGEIDFFDNQYGDNGFITYWAEESEEIGIDKVKRKLYIWKRLLPAVEKEEGALDLYDPEDSGVLSYWSSEVEKLMKEDGLTVEEAIDQIVNQIAS